MTTSTTEKNVGTCYLCKKEVSHRTVKKHLLHCIEQRQSQRNRSGRNAETFLVKISAGKLFWLYVDINGICSVMIECYQFMKADSLLIRVLEHMQHSRMGLYLHEGDRDGYVYLRELYTDKRIKTHVCSGYLGFPGELWFTRLLPDPISGHFDYSIHFMTPYVIIDQPRGKVWHSPEEIMPSEKAWVEFIARNLKKTKEKNEEKALYHFMKYGLTKYYWTEYVFQGYVNNCSDMIWLTGFPDRPESLPHASESHAKWLTV